MISYIILIFDVIMLKLLKKYLKTNIFHPKIILLKTIDIYFRGETFKGKAPLNE